MSSDDELHRLDDVVTSLMSDRAMRNVDDRNAIFEVCVKYGVLRFGFGVVVGL